jgi:putative cyclase
LPRRGTHAQPCAWGVFGGADRVGRLNLVDAAQVRATAASLRSGVPVPLNWRVDRPDPGILGRTPARHTVHRVTDGWDDHLDGFHPQGSSQWDALCHCRHPELGYYNGVASPDELDDGAAVRRELGVHVLAERGIATRFVLADVAAYRAGRGEPWSSHTPFGVDHGLLADVLRGEDVRARPGDLLLLRTGWISDYEALTDRERADFATRPPAWAGLAREPATLAFLWDAGIAGIASDNPTVEVAPCDVGDPAGFLHYQLIPLLGFLLGELFALDELARRCAAHQRWEGMLVAAPLNLPAGVGSPANAIAFV